MKKPQQIISEMIENAMAPFKRRMRTMIMRAVVELVTESSKTQTVQVSRADDLLDDDVERFQDFGFSAVPLKDSEAIVLMVGGSDHPVAIKIDDKRYRPKTLAEGEACVWIVKDGAGLIRLHCKASGEVHLGTTPTKFVALAPPTEARLAALEAKMWSHTHVLSGTDSLLGAISGAAQAQVGPTTLNTPADPVAATEVKAK